MRQAGSGWLVALGLAGQLACDGGSSSDAIAVKTIDPAHGPLAGGQVVHISGKGFLEAGATPNLVLVGGELSPQVSVLADDTLEVVTPAGPAAGPADVLVFNNNGFAVAAGIYSYNPQPTLLAIDPPAGPAAGGDPVTLTGTGFRDLEAGDATVLINGDPATAVQVISDTEIHAKTPPGPSLTTVDVSLANANGAAELPQSYAYRGHGVLLVLENTGVPGRFLAYVDVGTGEVRQLGEVPILERVGATATAPDGTIYAVGTGGFMYQLGLDGSATRLFDHTVTADKVPDLTFLGDTLYAITRPPEGPFSLATVDLGAGALAPIGQPSPAGSGMGLASDGTDLYVAVSLALDTIAPATGILSAPLSQLDGGKYPALAFVDGELYGVQGFPVGKGQPLARVAHINRATGITTTIASVPGYSDSLTFAP